MADRPQRSNHTSSRALARVAARCALALALLAPGAGAQQAARTLTVDSVLVEGNARIPADNILAVFGVQAGDVVNRRDVQLGIRSLYASGQFENVVVESRGTTDPYTLIIRVEETPLISRVVISGLEHASPRDVRDTTGVQVGQPLSQQKLLDAQAFIRSELADEGIPFANIVQRVESTGGEANEVEVFLEVTEGNRVTVAEVAFTGNDHVSDGDLRGAMAVRREGFWWFQSGAFNELDYRSDIELNIPDLYRSRGYLDARIVSDTVIVDPNTGKARLEVEVDEGAQYRLASFTVEGNTVFDDESFESLFLEQSGGILRTLGLGGSSATNAEGQVFNAVAFEEALVSANERYSNQGYLYAQITPVVERVPPTEDDEAPLVRASWQIVEGSPALIRRVSIIGNEYTHEYVIRNQLSVLPGDVYSQNRLIQSYQSISALGFFEVPMPTPRMEPDPETGDVDITFEVVEKSTGTVNFGTSVGGGVGLSGFIGYEQPNLFGQAKSGTLRWDFGRYVSSLELAYADPSLFRTRTSGRISLFNSQDRFFQFASGRRRRLGTNVRFGFPWRSSLFTRFFVGYGISRTTYEVSSGSDDNSLFGRPPGVQSQLTLGVTRATLDHPIFPTAGSRQNIEVQLNGGPVLGGDGDFTRVLADGSWWVPVGDVGGTPGASGGVRFALGLALRAGAVFGNVDAFPFDRFWMGGVQFGQQLRGYDETSITPAGYFPERSSAISDIGRLGNAFFSMTAQYAIRMGDQLSTSFFFDAGNVWRDPADFDPNQLYRGAGLGLQLVTPFGPIGLDYAYGFDKTQPGWQFHFRMGPGF